MNRSLSYAAIISVGGFIFGFDAAVISGVVGDVTRQFDLNTWQQGLVVSSPTLGGIIAGLTMGPLADLIGRKRVLILLALLYIVSAGFSALAPNVEMLILARFIGGLAFGSLMIAPLYIAEITHASTRGAVVSMNQLNIVVGLAAAYFSNYFMLQLSQGDAGWVTSLGIDTETWRWMLGIELLPALIWLLCLPLLPESPRWLLVAGQHEAAENILKELYSAAEYQELHEEISQTNVSMSIMERLGVLLSPSMRFALGIGLIVGVAQQITGVNAIYFYAPTIFEASGVGTDAAFAQATLVGIINVVFTVVAILLIDKLGRRPLLIMGLAGVALSLTLAAVGFSTDDTNPTLVLIGILGFVASFAVSLGPVMWVLFSEIFPNRIRGFAIAIVGAINSFTSFVVQQVFPVLLDSIGGSLTLLFYVVMAVFFLVLVVRYLPETRGKTLEELEVVMGTRSS